MFSIRGKLVIYTLEVIAAVTLLLTIIPSGDWWVRAGLLALSAFALGMAVLMGHSITSAVEELARAARRIGEGDYETPVPVRTTDEIGQLAAEIERMRTLLREKVRLLEELGRSLERKVEERTSQLRAANDRLALIHEITNTVSSSLDFHTIFESVISGTRRLVDFDQATVARLVTEDQAIVFAISGADGRLAEGRRIPLPGSRLETVLRSGRAAVFDRPPPDGGEDTLRMSAIVREVILPLTVGDQTIGTFNLGSRRPDAFGGTELEVLGQIASELGVALLQAEAYDRERHAAEQLKELSDLKSEFVSKVSHELRTPLTSILGFVDNLLDGIAGPLADKPRSYLERIRDNGQRLLRLINDLLDLSRIEAGEEEIAPGIVDLGTLVPDVVENVRPLAEEQGVELHAESVSPLTVFADRDKIARVLTNLVQNGIKFTDSGGRVAVTTHRDTDGFVSIDVRDNGPGIPPDELGRIFDRFHQVRRPGGRKGPGTGLGLAISRELVRLHGGDLLVESTAGLGSTFRVRLPVGSPQTFLSTHAENPDR